MRTGLFSKMATKCATCEFKNDCDNKRMVACAYLREPQIMANAAMPIAQPIMADIAIKHDYRDIKIGENTTVTIDIEDLKRELAKSLSPMCFLEYGG